jgi:hypothetical protein
VHTVLIFNRRKRTKAAWFKSGAHANIGRVFNAIALSDQAQFQVNGTG